MVSYNFLTLFQTLKAAKTRLFSDVMKHWLYLEDWMIMWPFLDTHWDQFQRLEAQHIVFLKVNPKQGLAFIGPLQSALNALLRML